MLTEKQKYTRADYIHGWYHDKDIKNRLNTDSWEVTATDRDAWRHTVKVGLSQYEETLRVKTEENWLHKRLTSQ